MIRVVVIKENGESDIREIEEGVEALQEIVGGSVDIVRTNEGDIWVHDEGIYMCEPNPYITVMLSFLFDEDVNLFGPVVITGPPDNEGDTLGLTEELAEYWLAAPRILNEGKYAALVHIARLKSMLWANKTFGRDFDIPSELASSILLTSE